MIAEQDFPEARHEFVSFTKCDRVNDTVMQQLKRHARPACKRLDEQAWSDAVDLQHLCHKRNKASFAARISQW